MAHIRDSRLVSGLGLSHLLVESLQNHVRCPSSPESGGGSHVKDTLAPLISVQDLTRTSICDKHAPVTKFATRMLLYY